LNLELSSELRKIITLYEDVLSSSKLYDMFRKANTLLKREVIHQKHNIPNIDSYPDKRSIINSLTSLLSLIRKNIDSLPKNIKTDKKQTYRRLEEYHNDLTSKIEGDIGIFYQIEFDLPIGKKIEVIRNNIYSIVKTLSILQKDEIKKNRNYSDDKIKTIRNNFAKNIHLSWHIDKEGNYHISKQTIKVDELVYVINNLLSDQNSNVINNTISTIEFIIKKEPEKVELWLLKIINLFNANLDDIVNLEMIHFFKDTKENSLKALLKLIKSTKDNELRYKIIFIFGEMADYNIDFLNHLKEMLNEETDEKIRSISALTLGKLKDEDSIDILIDKLKNDQSDSVRLNSAFALGEIKSEKAIDFLVKALDDKNPHVQTKAAEALGKFYEKAINASGKLLELLSKSEIEEFLIKEVIWALGKIKVCDSISHLINIMKFDFNSIVREEAIKVIDYLYHMECKNALDALPDLISIRKKDPDVSVRIIAARTLKNICEKLGLTNLDECIKSIKPYPDKIEQYWENINISKIEEYFDNLIEINIENKTLMGISFFTYEEGIHSIDSFNVYSLLAWLGDRISKSKVDKAFVTLFDSSLIKKHMGGYRLTIQGKNKIKEITTISSNKYKAKIVETGNDNMRKSEERVEPTAFISYSWDDNGHKDWVRTLAIALQEKGVYVHLDQWDIGLGGSLPDFMEGIDDVDFIIVVCTKGYLEKSQREGGGVKFEDSIIKAKKLQGIEPERIIPIFKEGLENVPPYLQGKYGLTIDSQVDFESKIEELIRHIHKEPKMKRPPLGKKPKFSKDELKQERTAKALEPQIDFHYTLQEFLDKAKPKILAEKIILIARWKELHAGIIGLCFKSNEFTNELEQLGLHPKTFLRILNDCVKKQWMIKVRDEDKKSFCYKLTKFGLEKINKLLND